MSAVNSQYYILLCMMFEVTWKIEKSIGPSYVLIIVPSRGRRLTPMILVQKTNRAAAWNNERYLDVASWDLGRLFPNVPGDSVSSACGTGGVI